MAMPEEMYRQIDRRPIPARNWGIARLASRWLALRGVSPNTISLAGMLCGIGAGAVLTTTSLGPPYERPAWVVAAMLILLRLTANLLDGMVAVECGRPSPAGELYNEVPDRISDAATLIGLGYAAGGDSMLGYAAAGAALLVAYIRAVGKVAGAHQEFGGPMAKQQRMFTVIVVALFLGLSPRGWQPAWGTSRPLGLAAVGLAVIIAGSLWTSLWRLRRIARALTPPGRELGR